jgi:hypothetical protein
MKFIFLALLGTLFWQTGCTTYQVVQQQNGNLRGHQLAIVEGGDRPAVTAYQGTGSRPYYPPSTYPNYNGYPGSGYRDAYPQTSNDGYPPDGAGIRYPPPWHDQPAIHAEFNLY